MSVFNFLSRQAARLVSLLLLTGFLQLVHAETFEEGKDAYLNKDYARALEILKPLAEQGNSQAQITMGLMHDYGHGVPRDPTQSIKWYRMAAEQGVPLVQHDLGVKYFQGQGIEQNYKEAAKWWEMSSNAGIADSQFNLGLMYYRGIGIDKDHVKAAELFEKAAAQGHGNAQYSLAVMYAFGQSKPKDYNKALEWFRKSAAQEIAQAQFNLGVFYENGYGVDKDLEQARDWYVLAANQGLQEAIEKLRRLETAKGKKETTAAKTTADQATKQPTVAEGKQAKPVNDETTVTQSTPPASASTNYNLSNWLRQQPADQYTLQLGSLVNETDMIKYVKGTGLGSNVGYIKVIVKDVTRYNAIYGIYDTYENAQQAIQDLPAAIRNSRPWVRNTGILQGILF